jgi:glycosyltransferase involved in cell wall biosynthesis
LTVVGDGHDSGALRRLAGDLKLQGVEFVGRVQPHAIAAIYADHDIYVQSPDIDNMPLSILEAFASGLPVVSTGVGGIPAILEHERHGLLSAPGDHQALAANVLRVLRRQGDARRMARQAFDTLYPYTWPSVRERWLSLYRSVLPHPAGSAAPASA